MSKLSNIKKIIISFIIITIAILINGSTVQAIPNLSVGRSITVGFSNTSHNSYKLTGTKWLYCIDHRASLSSYRRNVYTVQDRIRIVGNQATNGKDVKNSKHNAGLAYILSHGEGYGSSSSHQTDTQWALWYYWNTWLSKVGSKLGIDYDEYKNTGGGSYNSIAKKAVEYADNYSENKEGAVSITGAESIAFTVDGSAPYKATFTGKVSEVTVLFDDGTGETITSKSNNVKFYRTKNQDGSLADEINIKKITSGETFYIYNNTSKSMTNLSITVKRTVKNVYTATIYTLKSNTGSQKLIAAQHGKTNKNYSDAISVKVVDTGNLRIRKFDETYKDLELSGAEFKLYSNTRKAWVTKTADGKFEYNTSTTPANATAFASDPDGQVYLEGLKFGEYTIYETKAPIGYDITKQSGYQADDVSRQNNWVCLKTDAILDGENMEATYDLYNRKIVDKLEGFVWLDKSNTKVGDSDGVYTSDTEDYKLGGIEVHLCQNGNIIAGGEGHKVYTDSEGHYEFTQKDDGGALYYWDLANYYVEFIYDNKTYVCVDPFVGNDISNNSKAQEYTMTVEKLDDNQLTGTEGANPGRAVTYRATTQLTAEQILENNAKIANGSYEELTTTPLTGYYNENTYTISNINLGLIEQVDPTISTKETLAYIKVKMKGYTYTYKYGDSPVTTSTNVPTVNEQNLTTFSSTIYPTDIAYNIAESTEELQVYVVYRIDVENNTRIYIDNNYNEQKLYLDSLTNNYDTNRYELCTGENNEDSQDFALWSNTSEGVANYDVNNQNSAYKNGITDEETISSYIQFKIKEEALERLLTIGAVGEDIESAPTIATATGYHEYLRTDNVWVHDDNVIAFEGCKGLNEYPKTSDQNKKYYVHKSINVSSKSSDLYLKLKLGEARTITGTVFEDLTTQESIDANTHLGNGTMDDGEDKASSVKVELLNADKTTVSKLYQTDEDGKIIYNEGELPDAVTTTDLSNGTFTFTGIVPGYYYVRFTYGDGTQKLIEADKVITTDDYKSTIINTDENGAGDLIKNAMEAKQEELEQAQQTLVTNYSDENAKKLVEWYKYLNSTNYSTAVDDINQRQNYKYNEDGTVQDADGNEVTDYPAAVNSYTPMLGISIENDVNNYTDNGDDHKTTFGGFNFGVITEPDTDIEVEKKMTNVQFTTQTGSTLVSENPAESKSQYLTALDEITGGSQYARVEMDPTLIYGSTLETTYQIKITNHTVKDYIEDEGSAEYGYYFKYGEITDTADLKEIFVNEVVDKLDEKYNYDSVSNEVTETVEHEDGSTETSTVSITKASASSTSEDGLSMTNWSGLESESSSTIEYSATSLLANDDDTSYDNEARITSLSLNKLTRLTSNYQWDDISTTTITITPATGSDRATIYWYIAAGAIGLIILTAGIIIIKKKILK